jgi:hypothetical protein
MPVGSSSARAIEAGAAFVRLFTVNKELEQGLDRAKARVAVAGSWFSKQGGLMLGFAGKQASAALGSINSLMKGGLIAGGAAAGGTLGILGKALFGRLDTAAEMQRLADKLGESTDRLSAFAYAAETTGIKFEELADDFENWPERLAEAARGTGEAGEAFRKLGLTQIDLMRIKKLPITEQMIALAEAMKSTLNETDRLMLLGKFFSDKGQYLNQFFRGGAEGIRGLMAQAGDVGAVMDPTETRNQAEVAKTLDRAWTAAKNTFYAVGAALLPTREHIDRLSASVIGNLTSLREWLSSNREVVQIAAAVAAGVLAISGGLLLLQPLIGTALIPLQIGLAAIATFGGIAASGIGLVASMLAGLMGLVGTVGFAAFNGLIAAVGVLFTPTGLLVGGVAWASGYLGDLLGIIGNVTEAFLRVPGAIAESVGALGRFGKDLAGVFGRAADLAKERWGQAFASLKDVAATTWEGITSAISRGDLAAAGEIAISGLKLAWLKLKPDLEGIWLTLKAGLTTTWDELVAKLKEAWKGVDTAIQDTITKVSEILKDLMPLIEFAKSLAPTPTGPEDGRSALNYNPNPEEKNRGAEWIAKKSVIARVMGLDPKVFENGQQAAGTLSAERQQMLDYAAKMQAEAIARGMSQAEADAVSRGIISKFRESPATISTRQHGSGYELPALVLRGKKTVDGLVVDANPVITQEDRAFEELMRRRQAGIMKPEEIDNEKRSREFLEKLNAILPEATQKLDDMKSKWGGALEEIWGIAVKAADSVAEIAAAEANHNQLLEAEQAKLEAARKASVKMGDIKPVDLKSAGETLASTTRGLFTAPDFAMALGQGDKIMVDLAKQQADAAKAAVVELKDSKKLLIDIVDVIGETNRWA